MGLSAGKRKAELVDLTNDDEDFTAPRNKQGRTNDNASTQPHVSGGHRFGQDTAFVPLSQASQVNGYDEDDGDADQIVQSTQGFDDAAFNSYTLYGKFFGD
jgi:SWI/SNF-related matrix-associated actin-dependent regulator of chromatin subfamily A3